MVLKTDDDLFHESTMTFGQHLEELRRCLFKAIIGLALGTLIGLAVGDRVVTYIQKPLQEALVAYCKKESDKKVAEQLAALKAAGYDVSDKGPLREFLKTHDLALEEVYVNPRELAHEIESPEKAAVPKAVANATPQDGGLKRIFLWRSIENDPRVRSKAQTTQEPFMIWIKASLLVGVVISSPWVFFQIWNFVGAGLYRNERRYVYVFLPLSLALFLSGAALAFFFAFKPILKFLFMFNSMQGIDPYLRISEWMSFVLFMPLGFGLSFQLPLVMLFLERIGIVTVKGYLTYWRMAVLLIFVVAMFFSPSADPYSLLLLACPLCILYFGGVLLCRYFPRRLEG